MPRKTKSRHPTFLNAWDPSGTDRVDRNHIIPHTQEAGNPYENGDVYEKIQERVSMKWASEGFHSILEAS